MFSSVIMYKFNELTTKTLFIYSSIYSQVLITFKFKYFVELPLVRRSGPKLSDTVDSKRKQDPFIACRVAVIKWVAAFTHVTKKAGDSSLIPPQSSRYTCLVICLVS